MSDIKKFIDAVDGKSSKDTLDDEARHDGREGNRQTLRDQMFGYLEDAQTAIDEGNFEQAKEYIGYVIELVDDNV